MKAKYLTKKTQAGSVEAIRLLDELLMQLVVSVFLAQSVDFGERPKELRALFGTWPKYTVLLLLSISSF